MVHRGTAIAGAQLLWTGRAAVKTSGSDKKPVLPVGAGLGFDSAADHRGAGDGDRLSGGDFRRLLVDASGGSPGISVADAYHSYVRNGVRADLHSVR